MKHICCASPLCDLHVYCFLTTLPLGPLPHTVWGRLPVQFFTQRISLKYSRMLLGDVGCWTPHWMLAPAFAFQIFALPGAPRDVGGTSPPPQENLPALNLLTASNKQQNCWMRSSRRPSFVSYEWSQSGRPKISTKRQVQCSAPQGFRQQGTQRQSHQCRR